MTTEILTEDEIRAIATEYGVAQREEFEDSLNSWIDGTPSDECTEDNLRQFIESWDDA